MHIGFALMIVAAQKIDRTLENEIFCQSFRKEQTIRSQKLFIGKMGKVILQNLDYPLVV